MKFIFLIIALLIEDALLRHTTSSKTGLDFLVLGDWGGLPDQPFTTDIEEHTAKQMSITAHNTSASFVVALGDNFYYHGVKDEHDARFKETYSDVFNQKSLQVPWYVIGGNHDHYGNISGQIFYSRYSPYWKFPSLWHSQKMVVPGTNRTLKLVLIDTVVLCGNSGMDWELEQQPKGPENGKVAEEHWSWLKEQLKYSRDDYLLVGGHFPVWSIAEHGPTHCLVNRLKPMLEKYQVNAYLCGHDHNLQHIQDQKFGVEYLVVGSANFVEPNTDHKHAVPLNSTKFYWADEKRKGGFAHVRVGEENMVLSLIDSLGGMLHRVVMKSRAL